MTLREYLTGELVDIIEWVDESNDTMSLRYSRPHNEIKNGAQLIVRPGQVAVLVDQGRIADVYQPGRHVLDTANMPLLSSLRGWKYGFASPFKADVVFLNTKQFVARKWGTSNPIILRDPQLGPIRLRAFGTYSVRISNPREFVQELVGSNAAFSIGQIAEQLRDLVVAKVSSVLADDQLSIYDVAKNYAPLGSRIQDQLAPQFEQYGLSITQLVIENVSLPPEVEATIDQKTRLQMLDGDLDRYSLLQSADAMRDAARNPGGAAAAGVGIGIGAAMAQKAMQQDPPSVLGPPPIPRTSWYYVFGGERQGPVDEAALAQRGLLTRDTLVWTQGFPAWTPAGRVPELAHIVPPSPA